MSNPWWKVSNMTPEEREDNLPIEIVRLIANKIGCEVDELEMISDSDDPDMYDFNELDFEKEADSFFTEEKPYPSDSTYLSIIPFKEGEGFYVCETSRGSGGTVNNMWREALPEE